MLFFILVTPPPFRYNGTGKGTAEKATVFRACTKLTRTVSFEALVFRSIPFERQNGTAWRKSRNGASSRHRNTYWSFLVYSTKKILTRRYALCVMAALDARPALARRRRIRPQAIRASSVSAPRIDALQSRNRLKRINSFIPH